VWEDLYYVFMKIWNFLLPATGSHEFKVENEGSRSQQVFIDGTFVAAPEGTTLFTGPSGSLLELRQRGGTWELLVNGLHVEEYTQGKRRSHDDTLRDLRSRPEGSYTIATAFSAETIDLNEVRRFRFTARGEPHTVAIAHRDWVWQIVHNGSVLDRRSHTIWENHASCTFSVDATTGEKLDVEVIMSWDGLKMIWMYSLSANHLSVPACWTKVRGDTGQPNIEVLGDASPQGASVPQQFSEPDPVQFVAPPVELPQGVSFDAAGGCYQANIRMNNKFVFLGEYRTMEEAQARYVEEAEKIRQRAER
jgi:hypothetical protein